MRRRESTCLQAEIRKRGVGNNNNLRLVPRKVCIENQGLGRSHKTSKDVEVPRCHDVDGASFIGWKGRRVSEGSLLAGQTLGGSLL
jgi:hypothetical protein